MLLVGGSIRWSLDIITVPHSLILIAKLQNDILIVQVCHIIFLHITNSYLLACSKLTKHYELEGFAQFISVEVPEMLYNTLRHVRAHKPF